MTEEIHAKVGETFEIEMKAIPGAGMTWEIMSNPKSEGIASFVKKYWEADKQFQSGGGKNIQHFVFSALAKGKIKIIFKLKRSWEKNKSHDEKEYLVVIDG